MAYSRVLLDHLENPRNVGELAAPAMVAEVINSACGDRIRLSLQVEGECIVAAKMRAYGCAPTLAAASVLTELVAGKSIQVANSLAPAAVESALEGLPRGKKHAADLAIEALQAALSAHAQSVQLKTGGL
ncbi:MAG: iron-sulfur cluster assembly scaffold protein [Acidobacteriota bacterium]